MSVSIRPLLFPAVAVAAAATVAVSPVLAAAPAHSALAAASIIDVRTADVALAGIGQDIYYAVTPTVKYVVGGGSYLINFIPLIGGVIAAQININYFQGIQPVVEATVNALAGVVQDPFAIVATLTTYASTLYDIGYNWVSAELRWAGLAPLPPLPSLPSLPSASVGESAPRPAGARAAAAVEQPSVRDLRRAARAAVADRAGTAIAATATATATATGATAAATRAADAPEVPGADTPTSAANTPSAANTSTAAADTPGEVRSPARATRGQSARAVRTAAADTAG